MISIKCPYCQVGLKVDEGKLPLGITSFKCPKCKQAIPVSLVTSKEKNEEAETQLLHPIKKSAGRLTVVANPDAEEQVFLLQEGVFIIGRQSSASKADLAIKTNDRSMSREHLRLEVKKEERGGYKHYLSDNNSKNHTLYNNKYLEDGEIVVLQDNDEIIIGHTILRFNL